jgi:hypothetical protein
LPGLFDEGQDFGRGAWMTEACSRDGIVGGSHGTTSKEGAGGLARFLDMSANYNTDFTDLYLVVTRSVPTGRGEKVKKGCGTGWESCPTQGVSERYVNDLPQDEDR